MKACRGWEGEGEGDGETEGMAQGQGEAGVGLGVAGDGGNLVVRETCRMMEGRRESIENGRYLYSEAAFLEMVAFRMSSGFFLFLSN